MSTDASTGVTDAPAVTDYDEMLDTLDVAIEECRRKIEEGRIRDVDREKARVKQWKALGYLINVRRQVAHDRDLEELAAEVERLKAGHETDA